ncbi:MAG: redox-sensing transcriptional repressor Rex [Lachnospiraceae bacterium]|nr:redox-sensing transcriptional repressor Rex [Lachnospiraceae bacterium]
MEEKEISKAVISRLPRYFRYLGELKEEGVEKISSQELSNRMKVTASQIRQDLNNFGGFGQQGYGYNVSYLYEEIGNILGLNRKHSMVLIGAGNLGGALAGYENFKNLGFDMKAVFDIDSKKIGKDIKGIPIMHTDRMSSFIKENRIDIAVIAIPKTAAVGIVDELLSCGIKAIWNYSHVDFDVPEDVIVENVHLSESLMRLSYNINRYDQEHK